MAAPQTPQQGPRRPRAWLARRSAAVLSVVAMLGLGGLMYWNDQQAGAGTAQASATNSSTSGTTSSAGRTSEGREGGDVGDGGEKSDDGGSIVDDIVNAIPGLFDQKSSGSNSGSSAGTSSSRSSNPFPQTSTRGS